MASALFGFIKRKPWRWPKRRSGLFLELCSKHQKEHQMDVSEESSMNNELAQQEANADYYTEMQEAMMEGLL